MLAVLLWEFLVKVSDFGVWFWCLVQIDVAAVNWRKSNRGVLRNRMIPRFE